MECKGYIRVLKRTGENGSRCPVMGKCIIGTALNCDMRINLKGVASEHCKIFVDNAGQGIIENLTAQCPTLLNGSSLRLGQKEKLGHGDLFTVSDRTFRWEYLASSPFCVQGSQSIELASLENSAPKKTVSVPFASLRHTPSTNRIAVVTPVRREDSTPIDNKIEKLKKSSIPVKKFYRHSLQGSETLFKKKSASRRSCAPNLVGTSVVKKLQSGSPTSTPQSYSTSRKSRLFEIVQELDVNKEIKKSSRKSVLPNSPAKGKKSIGRKSFAQLPAVSRTPTRKSIKGQLVVESMEVSPESQSSGKESTKKGRKSMKNVSNFNNEATDKTLLQRTPKIDSEGADKKTVFKSRLKTPKKRVLETPGSVQQNAKRMKLTPNVESNESRQAPSTRGKSSASKAVKKPLFSEMVKKKANIIRKRIIVQNAGKPVQMKLVRTKLQPPSTVPARLKMNSTGHAESPETIVIRKKIGTPRSALKRKSFSAKGNRKSLRKSTSVSHNTALEEKQTPVKTISSKDKTPQRLSRTSGENTPVRAQFLKENTLQATETTPSNSGKYFETGTPSPERTSKGTKRSSVSVLVSSVKHTPLKKSRSSASKQTLKKFIVSDVAAVQIGSRTATPKGKPTPLLKAVTPKGKPTPMRKVVTPKSKPTPLRKAATPKGKQTLLQKAATPKKKLTPQRNVASPKDRATPQQKAATPKDESTPKQKAVTPRDKSTPQGKAATPKSKTPPQRKAATPKGKTTPQQKAATPKGKISPQRKAATPKGKTTPQRKAVTPKGKTTPQRKAATPKGKTSPQRKAATPKGKTSPQRKAVTPKDKSLQRKAATPKDKSLQRKAATPKDKSPQREAATPKEKSTPQRKVTTPRDKPTPLRKVATPKDKPTPLRKVATPKDKSTPLRKVATPKDKSTPQRKAATPKDKSTPQGKAATPKDKSTPQRKAATPKGKTTPQRKAATPKGKTSPQRKAVTPKDKSPQRKAATPKDKSPQRKAATPKDKSPQRKAATPKDKSPQRKAATPKDKSPQRKAATPKDKSPQRKAATPKDKSTPPQKATTPNSVAISHPKAVTPKSIPSPQGKSTPKGNQTSQQKSASPNSKQTPQLKSATPKRKHTPELKVVTPKDTSSTMVLVKDIRVSAGKLVAMRESRSSRSKGTPVSENRLYVGKTTPNTSRDSVERPTHTKTNASSFSLNEIKTSTTKKTPTKERPASSAKKTPSRKVQSPSENLGPVEQSKMPSGKKISVKENSVSPVKRSSQIFNTSSTEKRTPVRLASILSPSLQPLSSTGRSSRKRSAISEDEKTQLSHKRRKTRASTIDSPDVFSVTDSSFDFGAIKTPQVPQETFVSPLSSRTTPNTCKSMDLSLKVLSSEQVVQKSGGRKSVKKTPRKSAKNLLNASKFTPSKELNDLSDIKEMSSTRVALDNSSHGKFSYSDLGKSPNETSKILKAKDIRHTIRTPGRRSTPIKILGRKSIITTPKSQQSLKRKSVGARHVATPIVQGLGTAELGTKKQSRTAKVQKSPKNDLSDFQGVKKLMRTPKLQLSPKNDLSNVHGVKKLLRTPKAQKSPKNDLNDVKGVKKLLATPKIQKTPRNDLSDVRGVKNLLASPKVQKSPRNDLRDVRGVKKLLTSPKVQKSPRNDLRDVRGVKKLLASPKVQKSPKNDLRDVRGVKKLLASPKVQKSPKNDLTDVRGVKKLISTPKVQASPKNDLTNVQGVKKLLRTPRTQKSPKNDLTDIRGVKKLLSSPRTLRSPKNNLTNVQGVKQIFKSPKVQKSPKNDLTDVSGLKNLFDVSIEESKNIQGTPLGTKGVSSSAKSSRKKPAVAEVVERTTRSRRKIDVPSPATSPKVRNKIEKTPLSLPADNVPSPKKSRKVAKSNDESTKNADVSNNSVLSKAIAEVHDKVEENLTPNQKGRSRNTRAKKRTAEVAVHNQSADIDVTPPKTRRTRKNTGSEDSVSQHTSDVTSVSEKSLVSTTPPRTRLGKNRPVAPGRSAAHRDRNISESSTAGSPATSKSAGVQGTSLSKKSPSKTRGRTKSIVPPLDSLSETESKSLARKSPKARRGRTKSVVVHIAEENENTSELSSPRIVEVESNAGNKKSPLKTRGRTKPSGVSTPVKEASPVRKVSPKGRRGRSNQSKSSATTEEPLQQVNNIEVKSALASPQKKQTRSRKGETKTVKFHESVVAAPEVQLSEKIPNKRSLVKGEEEVKEMPEKQSGKQSKKAVATRATRTKKTKLEVTETTEENDSENVRATRSTRRKKT